MSIGPSSPEALRMLETARLRDENAVLRRAVEHYTRPLVLGTGEHAVFLDVGGVARAALAEIAATNAR